MGEEKRKPYNFENTLINIKILASQQKQLNMCVLLLLYSLLNNVCSSSLTLRDMCVSPHPSRKTDNKGRDQIENTHWLKSSAKTIILQHQSS